MFLLRPAVRSNMRSSQKWVCSPMQQTCLDDLLVLTMPSQESAPHKGSFTADRIWVHHWVVWCRVSRQYSTPGPCAAEAPAEDLQDCVLQRLQRLQETVQPMAVCCRGSRNATNIFCTHEPSSNAQPWLQRPADASPCLQATCTAGLLERPVWSSLPMASGEAAMPWNRNEVMCSLTLFTTRSAMLLCMPGVLYMAEARATSKDVVEVSPQQGPAYLQLLFKVLCPVMHPAWPSGCCEHHLMTVPVLPAISYGGQQMSLQLHRKALGCVAVSFL